MIASTFSPPYYAVIFTSLRTEGDQGYSEMADKMVHMAKQQPGFLGVESARQETGITVSYWQTLEAIRNWKTVSEHMFAQKMGRDKWYNSYKVRICLVTKEYGFEKQAG